MRNFFIYRHKDIGDSCYWPVAGLCLFSRCLNSIRMHIQFPVRRAWLVAVLSLALFACHRADHPANTAVSRRMALVAALKELRGRILSGDKEQIDRIFSFPVQDSVFHPYTGDSLFDTQLESSTGGLTRQFFDAHFDKISGAAELEGFKGMFSFIDLDSLRHADAIDVDTALADDPASRTYGIHIQNDSLVDISYGTGHCLTLTPVADPKTDGGVAHDTVQSVKDTTAVAEIDNGEDDPSSCEHSATWFFSFDGKSLHLLHLGIAD